MNPGQKIKAPAIVRHKYKGEWEYAIVHKNFSFSPFGRFPPRGIKWVYQCTLNNTVQRIHVITEADYKAEEYSATKPKDFWWNNIDKMGPLFDKEEHRAAIEAHTQEPPTP